MKVERWESMYTTPSFMLCNHQVYNFKYLKIKYKNISYYGNKVYEISYTYT